MNEAAVRAALSDHDGMAKPVHVQQMEQALQLNPLLSFVEDILSGHNSDNETSTDCDTDLELDVNAKAYIDHEGSKIYNGIVTTKAERRADKARLYNFSKVKKSRKWLKNVLLSDSSSDEAETESPNERIQAMLREHKLQRKCQSEFHGDRELMQYQYYGVGILSNYDRFYEHQKSVVGPKKKFAKEQKKMEKKMMKAKMKKLKDRGQAMQESDSDGEMRPEMFSSFTGGRPSKMKKLSPEQMAIKRRKVWVSIVKKEIPKAHKQKVSNRKDTLGTLKKLANQCMKECKRSAIQSQKVMKETPTRARRLCKEMQVYWKRFEKVEKEHRKRAEKEALEQRKMDHELAEMKRQQRKLNFLITQTELYAHFMARKITGASDEDRERILSRLSEDNTNSRKQREVKGGVLLDEAGDDYDCEEMKQIVLRNAEDAYHMNSRRTSQFDRTVRSPTREKNMFANPDLSIDKDLPQPSIFNGKLKAYQLKGMKWLANLYDKGINGILADEMGLGKTVQTIAFLSYLAETHNTWGPFMVVAPASTLHNWQQEMSRFIPAFKVVPYWGNTQDRKVLRKFWNNEHMHTREASFHIVITSYQLVIQDVKYFQRIKWHYLVLDEAQALKSSSSVRWKILLGFSCRNRLLLTGTPIQNSMAELWALLHFIMPTLFDSHEEFNEWFSKDIESHVEKQSGIDENQLSRLHMILKPFMLRRVKKDVENELSDKIEVLVYCPLTTRQRLLYQAIKNKISIEDLLQSASSNTSQAHNSTSSLMNLVMQFRKVCNHPELFERREIRSPFYMKLPDYVIPKLVFREGLIDTWLPSKQKILYNLLSVFNPVYIHQSLHHNHHGSSVNSAFSFTRFINMSPAELNSTMLAGLLVRWLSVYLWLKTAYRLHHYNEWQQELNQSTSLRNTDFLLEPTMTIHYANVACSTHLQSLVFTSHNSAFYSFSTHVMHYTPETIAHRKIRYKWKVGSAQAQQGSGGAGGAAAATGVKSPTQVVPPGGTPKSPTKLTPMSPTKKVVPDFDVMCPAHPHVARDSYSRDLMPTVYPAYLYYPSAKTMTAFCEQYVSDRSAQWDKMTAELVGTLEAKRSLLYGTTDAADLVQRASQYFHYQQPQGLCGLQLKHGYSPVYVPDKETLVNDAGKLYVLDTLLGRLKREGHRVLIYSQMTRMIDILEEYMWHRKHTYMRLDGSSKISDRRDMVADFQTRSDIFVFLLSTRAGGLGINLTAADTVIFYDSDWNPTVDQQAMDRAHRLGQTKQVTVYRLICKGTIEERILQRAKEKSEIQRMVISGGNFRPDTLKPKEVVSLLLDDDEMERKVLGRQKDKPTGSEANERKRKRERNPDKKGTGRGPGRPRKIKPTEENVTIAADGTAAAVASVLSAAADDSILSADSACPSPLSAVSVGSEALFSTALSADDSSNDGLVIVDDALSLSQSPGTPVVAAPPGPPAKRGRGRPRGRPPGSGVARTSGALGRSALSGRGMSRRPRGRGSTQKAVAAAELAAAQAGKSAGYAAYGYSYKKGEESQGSRAGGETPAVAGRGGGKPHGFLTHSNPPS